MSDKKEQKTDKAETSAPSNPRRRKVSVKQVKLSDMPNGFKFDGIFKGFVPGEVFRTVDNKGELVEKRLQFAVFEKEGERHAFVADKGFIDAIAMAQVKENTDIEFVKLGKEKISKGREMNRYDIYV